MHLPCSFDNAEVYAKGKAEEIMGQAIKVRIDCATLGSICLMAALCR